MARTPQTGGLDVTERENSNSTSPTANQTGRVYSVPKLRATVDDFGPHAEVCKVRRFPEAR